MHVMGSVSPANERQGFSLQEEGVAVAVPTSPPSPTLRSCDIEGRQMKSAPHPPPPPPPPPPPLLPPPPPPPLLPLGPGLGDPTGGGGLRRKRVRSFFWKTIPEEQVKGRANLWTQGLVQQQYQIDVQTVEELFGQKDCQSNTKATPTRGGRNRSSFRETKEEVSILDSKRGMNIGIFLKQFKRSNQTIVDDIRHGNSEPYGAEPLRELLKLLPEPDEVKKLKSYRGDVSKLSLADSFVYLLVELPSYSVRIESMLLREEFPGACDGMRRDIRVLRSATKELMCCEELHAVLHLVLQAGNILNAGGYAGNAVGFKLSSLLSLADTKANKPGMNLLHFVALEAQKKDEQLLVFPQKLSHVQAAARISLESLDAELQWLMTRTRSVEENVQRDTELLQQLDDFLQSATSSLCSLRGSRQQLKKEGSELIDFFCEDRDTFRLDECFSIFQTFCSRFTDAVKENMEREAKEAARRRRLQELEEQKRHSWAGGEEVGGSFRLRCSSEADMSAAMTRHDEAGLLMELLTPKSHPRSPQSNSALGRSGSLRRSRNSPSSSPSLAAERDLNTLLEMSTPDHKVGLQRGGGGGGGGETRTGFRSVSPALRSPGLSPHSPLTQTLPQSPRVRTFTFPQNQQPQPGEIVPQTPSSPPKTSWSPKKAKAYLQTTTYLGSDAHQTPDVTVKPTSDSNQQSDHNNNGDDRLGCETALSDHQTQSGLKEEPTRTNKADKGDGRVDHNTTGKVSVVLETRTLVPELKVFDTVATPTSHSEEHHSSRSAGRHQDDLVITDLEEEEDDNARVQTVQNKPQVANVEKSDAQRDEEEAQEDPVIVWCVTGVCEAAGELTHTDSTHVRTDKDQCRSDSQGGNQPSSSGTANRTLSEPQPANEKPVPVPISSQPVPVSRSDDPSRQVSSPGWRPAEPASASKAPALTIDACEEGREPADQREEAADSTHDPRGPTVPKQPQDVKRKNKASSCITTNKNSTAGKTEPAPASKPPTKNTLTSKTRPAGVKPSTPPSTTSTTNKSRPVRTLTTSEKEAMRRVVPISRTNRPDKPPVRGSSSTAAPNSLTVPNPYSATFRRVERLSTPPSSRRSSVHKSQDPKDSKDQKTSGTQASAREQTQDLARKPSIRKPVAKPKPPQEEKICRSTLRALSQAGQGGGGGGGSISAPATPLHKVSTPSSSAFPGFARSTASSSFRQTNATLVPPPHSSHTGSDSSLKSSPKTTTASSVAPPGTSSPFTRTSSMRVSTTSRSSDLTNSSSSSLLRRTQSIRASPRPAPHDSLAPPKGHRRNDSGSFSDKSTHSKDSAKAARPSWR